ncbi:MAG: hypothetical protein ACFBSE_00585 [Prochloraceae cyanobacterium]
MNIETEAIQRFRLLVPFLPPQCLVFREIDDNSILLCLDFANCPDALSYNLEQFDLLIAASTRLGLAELLVYKINGSIVHKFILS